MNSEDNFVIPVIYQAGADALAQRISEVLSASPESLAKVKEITVSAVPVIAYRFDIAVIPEK